MKQLIFPLNTGPDYSAEAFVPTTGSAAVRAALAVLKPSSIPNILNGLVVVGAPASGKTHLAEMWRADHPAGGVVDGLESLDAAAQTEVFHTFNRLKEQGGALLVTSRVPVQELPLLADLKSRLLTLNHVYLMPPDDAELAQLVAKWAAERQVVLPPAVTTYLLTRAERSPAALRTLVAALDELSLEEKRGVSVGLVKKVLGS
ncbi:MAG: DnaA/Hda family protein [Alphaproteobacteria bacterium]